MTHREDILLANLDLAVPLWIEKLRRRRSATGEFKRERLIDLIVSKADVLQFGGGKKGEAAKVFNAVAEALAVLAYAPGGVFFAGRHWCADHQVCTEADRSAAARIKFEDGRIERVATTEAL